VSRLPPFRFGGGTAVVTGAASGIGEQLSRQLAARGHALVLVDRDADRLAGVAGGVRADHPGLRVDAHVADLAETDRLPGLAARIAAGHQRLDLLVNNAGVGLHGRFEEVTLDEFDWVMRVNFTAAVTLTSRLLPTLLSSTGSHIVNLSSLFGLIAPAGQSAYAASKFALRGFSEVLAAELGPRGVGVTTVHPGGIRTGIAATARVAAAVPQQRVDAGVAAMAKLLTYPPERAAVKILDAVERRRTRLLIGATATVPDLWARLMPTGHARILNRLFP